MTSEDFYTYLYSLYGLAFLFAILIALKIYIKNANTPNVINLSLVSIFIILFCFLIGNRPEKVGSDTMLMMIIYDNYDKIDKRDPFINILMQFLHNFTDSRGYIFFLSTVFFANVYLFIKNRDNSVNKFLFFFFFICMSYFLPISINVVRQGVALMFFLNAINYFHMKRWIWMSIFLLFSFLFHTTSIVCVSLFLLSIILNKKDSTKFSFLIFFLAAALSIANVNIIKLIPTNLGIDALDIRTTGYFGKQEIDYTVGFRPTFFIYNLFFAIVGYYVMKYFHAKKLPLDFQRTKLYLNYYLLTSAVFFTAFAIPYSDRWGLFSWIIIPLFFEPFFEKGGKYFAVLSVLFSATLFLLFQFVIS